MSVDERNGLLEKVLKLEAEMERARERIHVVSNKVTEHEAELESAGRTLSRLDTNLRDLKEDMNNRFDQQRDTLWRGIGALIASIGIAVAILG